MINVYGAIINVVQSLLNYYVAPIQTREPGKEEGPAGKIEEQIDSEKHRPYEKSKELFFKQNVCQ